MLADSVSLLGEARAVLAEHEPRLQGRLPVAQAPLVQVLLAQALQALALLDLALLDLAQELLDPALLAQARALLALVLLAPVALKSHKANPALPALHPGQAPKPTAAQALQPATSSRLVQVVTAKPVPTTVKQVLIREGLFLPRLEAVLQPKLAASVRVREGTVSVLAVRE